MKLAQFMIMWEDDPPEIPDTPELPTIPETPELPTLPNTPAPGSDE